MKKALNWLTTNRMFAVLWLGLMVWTWYMVARVLGHQWAWGIVVLCASGIVGLLLRHEWARWLGIVLIALSAANTTRLIVTKGLTMNRVGMAVGAAFIAWGLWKNPEEGLFDIGADDKKDDDSDPETLISLVLLRTTQRYLEPVVLAHALSDAWGLKIRAHQDDEPPKKVKIPGYDGFVADTGPFFIVFVSKPSTAVFLIHNHETNYFNDAEAVAAKVPNLRFAEIIRNHQAWLSVDLLDKRSSPETLAQAYQFIGKAVSALADDATLALLCPQHHFFNLWNESLEEQLCGPEPLSAFREEVKAPIIGVSQESGINDAIAEARRRWPEFVDAFHARNKEEKELPFIVKAPFTTDEHTEHMWLTVFALEPDYVHGHLVNDPFYHEKLKKGSQVEIPVGEVTDWVFAAADGTPVGNFTGKAVNEARRSGQEEA